MMVILEAATAVAPEADSLDVDDNASQLQVQAIVAQLPEGITAAPAVQQHVGREQRLRSPMRAWACG